MNDLALLLGAVSLEMSHVVLALVAALLLPALVIWQVMRSKCRRLACEASAAAEKQRAEFASVLEAEKSKAATSVTEAKQAAADIAGKLADVEQRFATHREVADRRQTNDSQEIERLESELAASREIAAQLAPTQARIKDLEMALAAEQGRVQAQEQAIAATNARAVDFEKRMSEAQSLAARLGSEKLEIETEIKKIRDEQAASALEGPEAELVRAQETNRQLEVKIANLQRVLKSTEARVEMVQKEFMNAVGVASAPASGAPGSAAAQEKKVRELEEKLAQTEAEARKRAREDGYKIAELEYRLSEALESAVSSPLAAPVPVTPAVESKSDDAPQAHSKVEIIEDAAGPAAPQESATVSESTQVEPPSEAPAVVEAPATPPGELPLGDKIS